MLHELLDLRSGRLADQVELDVLRRQVVEQPSPLPEQDRYDVQLHLVELPGPQQRLRRPGPVHHHVAVPRRLAGLRGALAHIGDVADAAWRRVLRDVVGENGDRYTVVVVALPAAGSPHPA